MRADIEGTKFRICKSPYEGIVGQILVRRPFPVRLSRKPRRCSINPDFQELVDYINRRTGYVYFIVASFEEIVVPVSADGEAHGGIGAPKNVKIQQQHLQVLFLDCNLPSPLEVLSIDGVHKAV